MKLLTILAGPSCSGKSTYQKKYLRDIYCISEDEVMSQLDSGEPSPSLELHQKARIQSFRLIFEVFQQGKTHIVYDSTNLTPERRKEIYHYFGDHDIIMEIVHIQTNFQQIYKQWEKRGKDIDLSSLLYYTCIFVPATLKEYPFRDIRFFGSTVEKITILRSFLENPLRNPQDFGDLFEEQKELQVFEVLYQSAGDSLWEMYEYMFSLQELPSKHYIFFVLFSPFLTLYRQEIKVTREYKIGWDDFLKHIFSTILSPKIQQLGLSEKEIYKYFQEL